MKQLDRAYFRVRAALVNPEIGGAGHLDEFLTKKNTQTPKKKKRAALHRVVLLPTQTGFRVIVA